MSSPAVTASPMPCALLGAGVASPTCGRRSTAARGRRRVRHGLVAAPARRGRWDVVHTHGNKGGVIGRVAQAAFGFPSCTPPTASLTSASAGVHAAALRRAAADAEHRAALAPATDVIVCVSADERRHALADGIAAGAHSRSCRTASRCPAAVSADPASPASPVMARCSGTSPGWRPRRVRCFSSQALERLAAGRPVPSRDRRQRPAGRPKCERAVERRGPGRPRRGVRLRGRRRSRC